jgi:hypothetical protein
LLIFVGPSVVYIRAKAFGREEYLFTPPQEVNGPSLRSRRQHKAWGASPRLPKQTAPKRMKRATALPPAPRARASLFHSVLGLAPQALFCHLLRRFRAQHAQRSCLQVISVLGLAPQALFCHLLRRFRAQYAQRSCLQVISVLGLAPQALFCHLLRRFRAQHAQRSCLQVV